MKRTSPAAERNKDPILAVLKSVLPPHGTVLEIASGTGEHVEHFARHVPGLVWQPSDPSPEARESIDERCKDAALPNLHLALALDAAQAPWPVERADAIVCINMIHISPWEATTGLMRGASRVLGRGGVLVTYGPYRRGGAHTAQSNEAFDRDLRSRNPAWGVRDVDDVTAEATRCAFERVDIVTMPANNFTLVFRHM